MYQSILKFLNKLLTTGEILILLLAGAYAGFSIWDNEQIYAETEHLQNDLLNFKPDLTENPEDPGASFEELLAINTDVCGWISMENTKIDYPVLYGSSNLKYLNTDVYGEFALAGSIFLDSQNDPDFCEAYALIHGHHMEHNRMFGDLDYYRDPEFAKANRYGELLTLKTRYRLKTIACLVVNGNDERIFNPQSWREEYLSNLKTLGEDALYIDKGLYQELISQAEAGKRPKLLALATCASESFEARTVVLTLMIEEIEKNETEK